jgi:hypothetical protein
MCFGIAQPRPTSAQGKGAQSPIVYTLAFEYLQGCETGKGPCKPTVIVRSSIDQGVTLIFPSGGTESDVYLYGIADTGPQTSDYGVLAYITKGVEKAPRMLRHDKKFHSEGVPVLDVSGLPDGEYRASIVSCGLGGSFLLKLSTAGH